MCGVLARSVPGRDALVIRMPTPNGAARGVGSDLALYDNACHWRKLSWRALVRLLLRKSVTLSGAISGYSATSPGLIAGLLLPKQSWPTHTDTLSAANIRRMHE